MWVVVWNQTKCLLCNKLHNKPIVWQTRQKFSVRKIVVCFNKNTNEHRTIANTTTYGLKKEGWFYGFTTSTVILWSPNAVNGVFSLSLLLLLLFSCLFLCNFLLLLLSPCFSQWDVYRLFRRQRPENTKNPFTFVLYQIFWTIQIIVFQWTQSFTFNHVGFLNNIYFAVSA